MRAQRRRILHEHGVLAQRALVSIAMRNFFVDAEVLLHPARGSRRVIFVRHILLYLAVFEARLSISETARQFGRDRRTVAYALEVIERRREKEARFDGEIKDLSEQLHDTLEELAAVYGIDVVARTVGGAR